MKATRILGHGSGQDGDDGPRPWFCLGARVVSHVQSQGEEGPYPKEQSRSNVKGPAGSNHAAPGLVTRRWVRNVSLKKTET